MSPESVGAQLRSGTKKFTNSADVEVVAELYRSYFEGVTSTATSLVFAELKWSDSEVEELALLLPRFVSVTKIE